MPIDGMGMECPDSRRGARCVDNRIRTSLRGCRGQVLTSGIGKMLKMSGICQQEPLPLKSLKKQAQQLQESRVQGVMIGLRSSKVDFGTRASVDRLCKGVKEAWIASLESWFFLEELEHKFR